MFVQPTIATITLFAGNFAPLNWAFCNGQLLAISQYDALYALIGTTFGGDGQSTFALPDLRGRLAIHAAQGSGLSPIALGQTGGTENTTMLLSQLPVHSHSFTSLTGGQSASTSNGNLSDPTSNVPAATGTINVYNTAGTGKMAPSVVAATTPSSGSSLPIPHLPPVLAMNYIICLEGVFPSRN